jgi:hypothetical protein
LMNPVTDFDDIVGQSKGERPARPTPLM